MSSYSEEGKSDDGLPTPCVMYSAEDYSSSSSNNADHLFHPPPTNTPLPPHFEESSSIVSKSEIGDFNNGGNGQRII